jgi:nitroreductase
MDTPAEVASAAAELATLAPSIHNSQPWRWRIRDAGLELYLEHSRRLGITDPDRRLAILSCGAALHHAATALAAEGRRTDITRLPDPADPDHLARLGVTGPAPVSPDAMRRVQTIRLRHIDRRPTTRTPVESDHLDPAR